MTGATGSDHTPLPLSEYPPWVRTWLFSTSSSHLPRPPLSLSLPITLEQHERQSSGISRGKTASHIFLPQTYIPPFLLGHVFNQCHRHETQGRTSSRITQLRARFLFDTARGRYFMAVPNPPGFLMMEFTRVGVRRRKVLLALNVTDAVVCQAATRSVNLLQRTGEELGDSFWEDVLAETPETLPAAAAALGKLMAGSFFGTTRGLRELVVIEELRGSERRALFEKALTALWGGGSVRLDEPLPLAERKRLAAERMTKRRKMSVQADEYELDWLREELERLQLRLGVVKGENQQLKELVRVRRGAQANNLIK